MKNKKGSTIVWAVMLIMVLMVIVGASLSFAYMSYNQSIKNRNKTQAELIANSAIKSLVSVIEDGNIEIPTTTEAKQIASMELLDSSNNEVKKNYGTISDIYVKRKDRNGQVALAYLTANYAGEKYTIYGYLVYSKNAWKCVQYDIDGNKNITINNSGNNNGNSGDNTDGDEERSPIGDPGGSTVAERTCNGAKNMLFEYFGTHKDILSFREWYEQQCEFMGNSYNQPENYMFKDPYHMEMLYGKCYLKDNKLDQLEDSIVQKAREKNTYIPTDKNLYVEPHFFSGSSEFYLTATEATTLWNGQNNYLIYIDDHWYTKKTDTTTSSGTIITGEYQNLYDIRKAIEDNKLILVE